MRALVFTAITIGLLALGVSAVGAQSGNDLFQQALVKERTDGNMAAAIALYQAIAEKHTSDRALVAKALVQMGQCYEKLGRSEARTAYERVVREFGDQAESVKTASARLAAMPSSTGAQVGQAVRLLWNDLGKWLGNSDVGPPSTDGRYLSFTGLSGNLALLDLRSGTTRSLTTTIKPDDTWVETSAVSPDGRQVAYAVSRDGEGEDLRVIQVSGGNEANSRSIYANPEGEVDVFGWSPDSRSVLVERDTRTTTQIGLIAIADGAVRVLHENKPVGFGGPSFSPDGRFLAYHRTEGANGSEIFVLTLDGRETRVVEGAGADQNPLWSPDGAHIVFRSNRTGTMSLWMLPVAGGTPTGPAKLVKANVDPFSPLGMTRSGALYYLAGSASSNVYTAELNAALQLAASPAIATPLFVNSTTSGAWSPDGQYLAYRASSPRGMVIRIRSVNTRVDREVPSLIQSSGPMKWFPDNQSLLVASRDPRLLNGQLGYYRMNVTSGHAELLHQTAFRNIVSTRPDLSPDGRAIFYLETPLQPVRFDIDSRRETRLTPVGTSLTSDRQYLSLAVSPDGTQVAYLGAASLVVAQAAGGEAREVIRFSGESHPAERADGLGLAWSPDQRYLFFVKPDIRAIWRVPLTGGNAGNIGISLNRIRALRMHPDGRRIAFDSVVDAPSELWALENFLPKAGAAH